MYEYNVTLACLLSSCVETAFSKMQTAHLSKSVGNQNQGTNLTFKGKWPERNQTLSTELHRILGA